MDPAFHPNIIGIFLILGILLLISSILQLFNGSKKNYALAFLGLITSLWFFRRFFYGVWNDYPILYLIFGIKEVFIAPLIYVHIKIKKEPINYKKIIKHFGLPILIYTIWLILVYFFKDYYRTISRHITYFITWYIFISLNIYIYWSLNYLKKELKPLLIPKVHLTIKGFLIVFGITWLIEIFISIVSLGIIWYMPEENDFLRRVVNGTWIYYFDWFVLKTLLFFRAVFLIFYGFIEIPYFKTLFYPKEIFYDKRAIERKSDIENKLSNYFKKEKHFKNKDLTIDQCCKEIGCTKKELNDYLKIHESATFSGYLNFFRVSEFKSLLQLKENDIYDINSIAEMAGFKSRATFYRVFKELEGITPTQFKQSLNK